MFVSLEEAKSQFLPTFDYVKLACKQKTQQIFSIAIQNKIYEKKFSTPLGLFVYLPVPPIQGIIKIILHIVVAALYLLQFKIRESIYFTESALLWEPLQILNDLFTTLLRLSSCFLFSRITLHCWLLAETIDILFLKIRIFFLRGLEPTGSDNLSSEKIEPHNANFYFGRLTSMILNEENKDSKELERLNFHLRRNIAIFIRDNGEKLSNIKFDDNKVALLFLLMLNRVETFHEVPGLIMSQKKLLTIEDLRDIYYYMRKKLNLSNPDIEYLLGERFEFGLVFQKV